MNANFFEPGAKFYNDLINQNLIQENNELFTRMTEIPAWYYAFWIVARDPRTFNFIIKTPDPDAFKKTLAKHGCPEENISEIIKHIKH